MARLEWKQGMDQLETIQCQRRLFWFTISIAYTIRTEILEYESTRMHTGRQIQLLSSSLHQEVPYHQ
eukprot:12915704-Prorocentrum_lima.AAC.1